MLPKEVEPWDVKNLCTIVLLDSEKTIFTNLTEENQYNQPYSIDNFLQSNIEDHSAAPCHMESTEDWY